MRAIRLSFLQMLRQLKGDAMLAMVAVAPFLMGLAFRIAIPLAEDWLTGYFGRHEILAPYYALLDVFLIMLTPSMLNFAAAMVTLEEIDDHVTTYLAVTPLGKSGYLASRLGLSGVASFVVSLVVAFAFHLSAANAPIFVGMALAGTIQGAVSALLIVALSSNKVEGMAVGKFTSVLSLGALVPYFVDGKAQFLASVFPSFWMGRAMRTGAYLPLLVSVLLALLWMALLSGRFVRKMA